MPWSGWPRQHPDIPARPAGDRDGAAAPTPLQGAQSRRPVHVDEHRDQVPLVFGEVGKLMCQRGGATLGVADPAPRRDAPESAWVSYRAVLPIYLKLRGFLLL